MVKVMADASYIAGPIGRDGVTVSVISFNDGAWGVETNVGYDGDGGDNRAIMQSVIALARRLHPDDWLNDVPNPASLAAVNSEFNIFKWSPGRPVWWISQLEYDSVSQRESMLRSYLLAVWQVGSALAAQTGRSDDERV